MHWKFLKYTVMFLTMKNHRFKKSPGTWGKLPSCMAQVTTIIQIWLNIIILWPEVCTTIFQIVNA